MPIDAQRIRELCAAVDAENERAKQPPPDPDPRDEVIVAAPVVKPTPRAATSKKRQSRFIAALKVFFGAEPPRPPAPKAKRKTFFT